MVKGAITLVLIAGVAWFCWHTYRTYTAETSGTTWEKLFAATKDSATIFFAAVISAVTATFNFVLNIADFFGADQFRDWAQKVFDPATASAVLLGCMLVVVLARVRNLKL